MLEIGLEVFYGNTKAGAISMFTYKSTQIELRDEYIARVKEQLLLDLNETSVAFYPALEGKFANILKALAKEKGLWFKLK